MKTDTAVKATHTPTPWKVEITEEKGAGTFVSVVGDNDCVEVYTQKDYGNAAREVQADAAFIVRAVNSHEGLLADCKLALEEIRKIKAVEEREDMGPRLETVNAETYLERAIAQAEGHTQKEGE